MRRELEGIRADERTTTRTGEERDREARGVIGRRLVVGVRGSLTGLDGAGAAW